MATMDELLAKYDVARIVAEDGSSVAHLARHWCKRNRVMPFTLVLRDETLAEVKDRPRRHQVMLAQKPHAGLIFNQFDRWLEFAKTMHAAGVPVNFVHATDLYGKPRYIPWEPGMNSIPQTPTVTALRRDWRKGRPKGRVTEEHKKEVKRRCTAAHDEKRRLMKLMKRIQDGTLTGQSGRFKRRGRYAIRRPGHAPTMMS